jgi:hypothetical protein
MICVNFGWCEECGKLVPVHTERLEALKDVYDKPVGMLARCPKHDCGLNPVTVNTNCVLVLDAPVNEEASCEKK